jgi:DNA-binding response OmpR family regulator
MKVYFYFQSMHLLLVEDHPDIGSDIQAYLVACGFSCDWVTTVGEAKIYMQQKSYHVAVLDWMLPDGSGAELCQWIKKEYPTPVILQTAKSQIEDKVEGFYAGADDYLVKPYNLRELEIRIYAVHRRTITDTSLLYEIAWFLFDTEKMKIWASEEEIHCTAHEWIVLKLLLENPGEVISRVTIVDYVRGSEGMRQAENKVDVLISGMRKKLGKEVIETVKGFWYRMKY